LLPYRFETESRAINGSSLFTFDNPVLHVHKQKPPQNGGAID
jgi:hypothetical protein